MIAKWTKNSALKARSRSLALTAGAAQHEIELAGAQVRQQVGLSALEDPYGDLRSRIGGKAESFRENQQRRQRGGADADLQLDVRAALSHSKSIRPSTHSMFFAWTTSLRPNGVNDTPVTLRRRPLVQVLPPVGGYGGSTSVEVHSCAQGRAPDAAPLRDIHDPEEVAKVDPVQLGDAGLGRHQR